MCLAAAAADSRLSRELFLELASVLRVVGIKSSHRSLCRIHSGVRDRATVP